MEVNFCFQETGVLEELGRFERHWHVRRKKLLPLMRLFWGRLPWRGGKRLNMCRKPRLGTENDFNHLVLWWYDNMIILGVDCLIERVKRWFVSYGAVVWVVRASACSPSMDGRETRAFYFIVCVLHVVSANSGSTTTQEGRGRKQRAQHQRRMKIERKSTKSRSEITEKPSQIDEKSLENRSWPVLGVQARFRDASGRVRDATWTRQSRLKSDLGTPRARQERPGDVQERARDVSP